MSGFEDDDLADIFSDDPVDIDGVSSISAGDHVIDGSLCPTCGIPHRVYGKENLTDDALHKLNHLLDDTPKELLEHATIVAKQPIPVYGSLAARYGKLVTTLKDQSRTNSALLALTEILDEITEGRATAMTNFYYSEQQVQVCHLLLQTLEMMIKEVNNHNGPPGLEAHMSVLYDAMKIELEEISAKYTAAAQQVGVEPDGELLEKGYSSTNRRLSNRRDTSLLGAVMRRLE